ncbi:MAG: SCO family protein [Desulforhopalus sp.]
MRFCHYPIVFTVVCLLVVFKLDNRVSLAGAGEVGLLEQTKQILVSNDVDNSKWVEEKTGEYLPLDLEFVDETGQTIRLADIIDRPTILLPIYFYCPNICSKNLSNLAIALNNLTGKPGEDYRVVAFSFNAVENHEVAATAKKNYLKILDDDFPADEWYFLTGSEKAIKAATAAVGFRFQKKDDQTFIHPAALMTIAQDGKIIRYVYGSFLAGDIDMALADAAKGQPSLSVKRLLGFCFNYDPDKNKSVFQQVKVGVITFFALGVAIVLFYFKRKKPRPSHRP